MVNYETVIGLEVHAQLLTRSKMFCACDTTFGAEPNTNICPICTGQPGTLPVVNRRAVEFAIRAGLATNCSIRELSEFSRKNYFYPDLPKGYQISQYDRPICVNGHIDIPLSPGGEGRLPAGGVVPARRNSCGGAGGEGVKRISLIRIHLEEDAGKNLHDTGHPDKSHIDFNRCGIPLIEIVSGPDIRSPAEGVAYLKTLRNILMYLEICDGNMQEGSFRVDANISIRPLGQKEFGTRTELKNMNSFSAIERALNYEIERQTKVLNSGGKVVLETLLWNEALGRTESMRSKEEAHDYRYFPEPDLPVLFVDKKWIDDVKAHLPELALEKAARFVKELGLPEYDANVLTQDKALAAYYESALEAGLKSCATMADKNVAQTFRSAISKKLANWIMTELLRELKNANIEIGDCKIEPQGLSKLVELVETNVISGKIGKSVFEEMFATGSSPEEIIKAKGLVQVTDTEEIEKIIDEVLAKNAESVAKYRSGKVGVFGHFVGEVMKATKGKANPKAVNDILKKKLQ